MRLRIEFGDPATAGLPLEALLPAAGLPRAHSHRLPKEVSPPQSPPLKRAGTFFCERGCTRDDYGKAGAISVAECVVCANNFTANCRPSTLPRTTPLLLSARASCDRLLHDLFPCLPALHSGSFATRCRRAGRPRHGRWAPRRGRCDTRYRRRCRRWRRWAMTAALRRCEAESGEVISVSLRIDRGHWEGLSTLTYCPKLVRAAFPRSLCCPAARCTGATARSVAPPQRGAASSAANSQ